MTARFTHSSGNVFADIGLEPTEAITYRLRSNLMIEVRRVIREKKLTQEQAANLFGVTQPRISDLVRGQIIKFSIDGLVEMLGKAGVEVTATFENAESCAPEVQALQIEFDPAAFAAQETWPAHKDMSPNTTVQPSQRLADLAAA
jgi:predicted XRE-type DNA-binding protein